jgi:hypothetical protein
MAQATCNYSRSHNFSNEALADAIGNADLALKAHEAEVKALKEKFKSRGLLTSLLTRDETQRIAANRRACSSAASGSRVRRTVPSTPSLIRPNPGMLRSR